MSLTVRSNASRPESTSAVAVLIVSYADQSRGMNCPHTWEDVAVCVCVCVCVSTIESFPRWGQTFLIYNNTITVPAVAWSLGRYARWAII